MLRHESAVLRRLADRVGYDPGDRGSSASFARSPRHNTTTRPTIRTPYAGVCYRPAWSVVPGRS